LGIVKNPRLKKLPVWAQDEFRKMETEVFRLKQALAQAQGEWKPTNFAGLALSYGGVGSQKRIYIPETTTVHFHFGAETVDFKFQQGGGDPPRVRVMANEGRVFVAPHTANVVCLIPAP
jgi:hypothetical protein